MNPTLWANFGFLQTPSGKAKGIHTPFNSFKSTALGFLRRQIDA
jgi:hypothetical protein